MVNFSKDRFSPKRLSPKHIKAKIEPQLHWKVPMEEGVYQDSRWSNPDLDPVKPEDRTWGAVDYWAYWTSDMLAPPLASTVSSVMSLGFTARETIPIVFCGFALCSGALTLTGKMGARYSIPFPVLVRSIFGMYGSYPVIVLRSFVAAMWTAILCVQAGDFLNNCLTAIWPSFANFPNHLPESAGITSAGLLCFFIYWIFQTILACMPIKKLRILFLIKGVVVPPTFLALFLWAAIVTKGGGPLVTGHAKITSTYMNTAYSSLTGLNAIIGLFSSMAVNFPDFSRFSKNNLKGYNQFFALPVIGTLGALTPIFVTSAHSYLWGEFEWYMPAVIAKFDSRAAKFFTAFSFMLATIGNQIAAGTYPFSNDMSNPWQIIKNAAGLLAFLSGYSMFMGAICGTMCSHYYLIVNKKLNIHEMYNGHGIYRYSKVGINWRAYASFFTAVAPLLPGFCKSIDANLDVGGAWKIYTFSCIYGFTVSGLVYYFICTYVSGVGVAKIDEAVYPPSKSQATDVEVGVAPSEEDSIEEKAGVAVSIGAKEFAPQ
ncbi:cytosine-purine permease [Fonsecaea pedrosoi]|nr:cytosine-purine permease [Fonsecaea pedrosoi]